MKTSLKKLFLVVAVAIPFMFTSCTESTEDRATITIAEGLTINEAANGNFTITGTVTSPEGTRIETIELRVVHGDHVHLVAENRSGDNTFVGDGNRFLFSINQAHEELADRLAHAYEAGETYVTLRFTATVRNGGAPTEVNVRFNFYQEVDPTTPLSAPIAFEWQRVGGANATGGLDAFGLRLNNTATAVQVLSSATKLVALTPADWAEITTQEELKAKIDAAGVAASIDFTFATDTNPDRVFGVLHNDTYHIFHVTRFRSTAAGDGTRTSIFNGQRKH